MVNSLVYLVSVKLGINSKCKNLVKDVTAYKLADKPGI
jgi:hypothetical protein